MAGCFKFWPAKIIMWRLFGNQLPGGPKELLLVDTPRDTGPLQMNGQGEVWLEVQIDSSLVILTLLY